MLGTLIMLFGLIQVLGAFFRPHKEAGQPVEQVGEGEGEKKGERGEGEECRK